MIVSDNAKTFKAAADLLKKVHANTHLHEFLNSRRITWKFNLERASWWEGTLKEW